MPTDTKTVRFIPQWTEDKRFTQGPIIVVVKRSNHWSPRYSYEILFAGREKQSRFYFVRMSGEGTGKIAIEESAESLLIACHNAESYIRDMYQRQEDEAIEKKAEKERRALDKDKPVQKSGLKALSKRDAGNRKSTAGESKS